MNASPTNLDQFIGESEAADAIRGFGRRAASVDAPVLLTGESGTGKGLLARGIHGASDRRARQFITVNCAGVPESLFESEFFGHNRGAFTGAHQTHRGLLEQAHGGTLFLDEIGELALALQAKLLTTLEDGELRRLGGERVISVDARLIAATSVDLEQAIANGMFRRDLYHRLLVLAFRLPPLRERDGDIDVFIHHALARFGTRYGRPGVRLDAAAHARLRAYDWPGNVRQLEHTIEAAVLAVDGPRIESPHLPPELFGAAPIEADAVTRNGTASRRRYSFYGTRAEEYHHIREVLRRCHGNKTRAAEALGMTRNTLRAKLEAAAAAAENGGARKTDGGMGGR